METATPATPPAAAPAPGRAAPPTDAAEPADPGHGRYCDLARTAAEELFAGDPEYARYGRGCADAGPLRPGLYDFLFAAEDEPHRPDDVFNRLRWGGQFIYLSRDRGAVGGGLAERFRERGYAVAHGPGSFRVPRRLFGRLALPRLPLLSRKFYYLAARKVFLIRPREVTDRFTYHVQLVPTRSLAPAEREGAGGHEFVVSKEVPTLERVMARLRARFSDLPLSVIERRARKFTDKIFPLFLTREAAMLQIVQRDAPREFRSRFPRVLKLEQDNRGYVRRLWMNWLRVAPPHGRPLTQLEFARQSFELLNVLHDEARVIHLDLRMDNFVITEEGVGFVDFGSAVRVGENIHGNPLLSTVFEELMKTSQIQRMLDRMQRSGLVTSPVINDAYQKVDKAVDLFYLAVQISAPHGNPDLAPLIQFDPESEEARALGQLTSDILKPADPKRPPYRTAKDVLEGVARAERAAAKP